MSEKKIEELLAGIVNGLPDELKEKAKKITDLGELTDMLSKAGMELPDELLDSAAGGINMRNRDAVSVSKRVKELSKEDRTLNKESKKNFF